MASIVTPIPFTKGVSKKIPEENSLKRRRGNSDASQSSSEGDRGSKNTDGKKARTTSYYEQYIANLSEKQQQDAQLRKIGEENRHRALTDWLQSNPNLVSLEQIIAHRESVTPIKDIDPEERVQPEKSKFDGISTEQVAKAIWGDRLPGQSENTGSSYPNLDDSVYDYAYSTNKHEHKDDPMNIDKNEDHMDID